MGPRGRLFSRDPSPLWLPGLCVCVLLGESIRTPECLRVYGAYERTRKRLRVYYAYESSTTGRRTE